MPVGRKPGSTKTGGRKAGTPNKRTSDGEAYARAILEDPKGIARMQRDFRAGKLPSPVLVHLLQLAYGTPKELTLVAIEDGSHDAEHRNGQAPKTRYILTAS